jgi:hypothetical protein
MAVLIVIFTHPPTHPLPQDLGRIESSSPLNPQSEASTERENSFWPLTPTWLSLSMQCRQANAPHVVHMLFTPHVVHMLLLVEYVHACNTTSLPYSCYRCVEGNNLFVCGRYIYSHYVDCADAHYYLSSDRINDILCLPPRADEYLPVLACQDNSLRILKVKVLCRMISKLCVWGSAHWLFKAFGNPILSCL